MTELVQTAKSEGVTSAVEKVLGPLPNRDFYLGLLDEKRGDFQFLLPADSHGLVLNLGSGWDGGSLALSRCFRSVVAADGTLENLEFLVCRAREARRSNMVFVHIDPLENLNLPFRDGLFSAVVLIGILEWIGSGSLAGEPRELQIGLLREVQRILKPGGCAYLAIENRFGALYWFGKPDPHAQIPFLSVLPRWFANRVMQVLRGKPYRTYTHSFGGLKGLLWEAGFSSLEFYLPLPEYRHPDVLIPLEGKEAAQYWVHNLSLPRRRIHYLYSFGIWLLNAVGLLKHLAPDFCVIARR